jgi:hypothetical protein
MDASNTCNSAGDRTLRERGCIQAYIPGVLYCLYYYFTIGRDGWPVCQCLLQQNTTTFIFTQSKRKILYMKCSPFFVIVMGYTK